MGKLIGKAKKLAEKPAITCIRLGNAILHKDIIKNCNHTDDEKKALLIYITSPFLTNEIVDRHQNFWQAKELARIIGEFGYQVDVADYQNQFTRLQDDYDLVIGLIPRGIDIYSKHLKPGAKKIAYLTSSNLAFTNASEQKRLDELFQRRGIRLKARRQTGQIDPSIETFDGALFFGNDYNLKSYDCFKMPPVYYVANNGYKLDFDINFNKDPHKFIFFGSAGQVHKGLDLLLEIFSEKDFPCELYVCGCLDDEKDFIQAYKKELYETRNIHTIGFVDIHSETFRDLVNQCAYTIMPSCAEGQAGSIVTLMSGGVIPICSKECGYDDDIVFNLPDCKIETIRNTILEYANKNPEWLEENAKRVKEVCEKKHSRESFSKSIREGLSAILNKGAGKNA